MQVIFATDDEPLSKLIRAITSCRWHHVGVVFDGFVIEARFIGVIRTPIDDFKARGEYQIVNHKLDDEDAALKFGMAQIGKGYDKAGLISFPFRARWQDNTRWYCSELVAAIAEAGGTPLVRSDLSGVSPRDLWVIPND
ncbi:MAG: hypothetical protein JKY89_10910 [Immundisolibacteraceae bacterium]|nr:hypothetical protein [Immundisolibacteraceae bacterium]